MVSANQKILQKGTHDARSLHYFNNNSSTMVHGWRLGTITSNTYKERNLIMESLTRSQEREMNDLYDEIFIHGTSYKSLLKDGFTIEEINHVLVKGGLKPITLKAIKEKLV